MRRSIESGRSIASTAQRRRFLWLLCLCALLAGCSTLYNYRVVGWWVRWYVEDYVHWSSTQEPLFRERVREQLRWHQRTQLPRYHAWLEQMRKEVAGPLDVGQLTAYMEQLRGFWTDVMVRLEPDFDRFLADLSDRQAREMIRRFRKEHEQTVEKYAELTPAKMVRERARDMRKGIERLVGSLDAGQRERIQRWAEQMPDSRAQWLASRARWIDALEEAMARRNERDYFARRVHELFVAPEENWDPEYRRYLEHNTGLTLQMLADVHNSLRPEQRTSADKNLKKWLDLIDSLAEE